MENEAKGLSLFQKILLTMLVVALIPLTGLWYISSHKAEKSLLVDVYSGLSETTDGLATRVDDWVDMNLRLLEQNGATGDMLSMDAGTQNAVLKSITDTYGWVYLAFTVAPDGTNVGRSDGKAPKYYGDRKYFRQVMDGSPTGHQVAIGKTSGKPAFILAKPIRNDSRELVGVIATAMHVSDVSSIVTDVRMGETGFAMLLDETGKAIAHGDSGQEMKALQDLSDHPAFTADTQKGPVIYEMDGRRVIAHVQATRQGWKLIVQQDYDDAFANLHAAQRGAFMLLAATLFAVLVVAYGLGRRFASPIKELTEVTDSISRGELHREVTGTGRGDEIGALARAIERLNVSMRMAMTRLKTAA